jgi:hypothetical protein
MPRRWQQARFELYANLRQPYRFQQGANKDVTATPAAVARGRAAQTPSFMLPPPGDLTLAGGEFDTLERY